MKTGDDTSDLNTDSSCPSPELAEVASAEETFASHFRTSVVMESAHRNRLPEQIGDFLKSAAKRFDLTLPLFQRLLGPQALKTTLGVEGDGRYGLIVEKRRSTLKTKVEVCDKLSFGKEGLRKAG